MESMTGRERIQAVLAGEIPDRVPYYEAVVDYPFICRLLDRPLDGKDNFDSGEYRTNEINDQLAINEILHRDNLVYCCLPPIPAHKMPGEDQIMFFHDGKIKTWEDIEAFELPDVNSEEFKAPMREFIDICHRHDYAAVALTRCGFSACYLAMGFEHFFLQLIDDPDMVEALLKKYAIWCAELVPVLDEAGFEIMQTNDDLSGKTGTLISPESMDELFWPHIRHITDALDGAQMKWCFHSDGKIQSVLDTLIDVGVDILDPIENDCIDIVALKDQVKDKLILAGNVDMDMLSRGTPDQVEEYILHLLENVSVGGGHLLASGNSLASYVQVENARRMCDVAYEYGRYPIDIDRIRKTRSALTV